MAAIVENHLFAWHGWRLELPAEWNPVRLEGDDRKGFVLLADLHRPRLGLRWRLIKDDKFYPDAWATRALREEVGQLAAKDARARPVDHVKWRGSTIYTESDPPGRDVWVAYSPTSRRAVEIIYHVTKRDAVLADRIVPALVDLAPDRPMLWSIFDLNCIVPAGMTLSSHQLHAGDLKLTFANPRRRLISIRQIAVAKLALSRMELGKWLVQEQRERSRYYRPEGSRQPTTYRCADGRELIGLAQNLLRRKRFFLMSWLPPQVITGAFLDAERDRLVLLRSSDRELLDQVLPSIGCAASLDSASSLA